MRLQDYGAAPLPRQQQRPLTYHSASTSEKDVGYFLDVSYLLTKPYDSLPFLYVSMHADVLCYMTLPDDC